MDSTCVTCGLAFRPGNRVGRPRIRCERCSPPKVAGRTVRSCARCRSRFTPTGNQKYCNRSCRDKDVWDRQKASNPCPGCGGPMARSSSSSASDQMCRKCRFGDRRHGTATRYRRGCRCRPCKDAVAAKQRDYAERRRAAQKPIDYAIYRATRSAKCEQCGVGFLARIDSARGRFCSLDCANDAQGRREVPRRPFKIARSTRLAIYASAGWLCSLCGCPVRPDEHSNHPRYPTLDHILPRALGGSDEPSNLRLACRQCNTLRGTDVDWVPEVFDDSAGRFATAV